MTNKHLFYCRPITLLSLVLLFVLFLFPGEIVNAKPKKEDPQNKSTLQILNEKSRDYWDISIDSSMYFSTRAIRIVKEQDLNSEEAARANLYLAVTFFYQSTFDSALFYATSGLEIAEKTGSMWDDGFASNLLCILYRKKTDYEKAIQFGLQTVEIRKLEKDTANLAGAYQNLANIYSLIGKPLTAVDYLSKSLQLSKLTSDTLGLMRTHGNIANLYLDMEDSEKGKSHLLQSLNYNESGSLAYADNILALGTVYHEFYSNNDTALILLYEALVIYENIGIKDGIATAKENIGIVLLEKGENNRALKYLQSAKRIFEESEDTIQIINIILSMGKYQLQIDNYDSANFFLEQALSLGKQNQRSSVIIESLKLLYQLHKKKGELAPALAYFEEYTDYTALLENAMVKGKFAEMESKYKAIEREQKIEQLTFDTERMKWREMQFYFLIALIILMVCIGGIILFFKRKKELKIAGQQQLLMLQKRKLMEAELVTKRAKQNEMEQDIEFKSKQLSTHALHMIQKNKMLRDVKVQLEELTPKLKTEFRPEIRNITRLLERNMQTEKEWKLFKMYFEQVNANFFKQLSHLNDKLNTNDLRHCALIKLNLNTKESASVLNLSPYTVKSARYRLKQKLNLSPEENLNDFIRNVT